MVRDRRTLFHPLRILLPFVLALGGLTGFAQTWCPPGAEWRYSYVSLDALLRPYGTLQCAYEGDVSFQGRDCQRIRCTTYLQDLSGQPVLPGPSYRYTSTEGTDVVLFWNDAVARFDTLVDLSAQSGDHWTLHGPFDTDKRIDVTSVGTRMFGGVELRYVVVTAMPPLPAGTDTIHERIGAFRLYDFDPLTSFWTSSPLGNGLGCYRDDGFVYQHLGGGPVVSCAEPLYVSGRTGGRDMARLFPNPALGEVRIGPFEDGQRGAVDIQFRDALGRVVLTRHVSNVAGEVVIELGNLARGLYDVQVSAAGRVPRSLRLIVEQVIGMP